MKFDHEKLGANPLFWLSLVVLGVAIGNGLVAMGRADFAVSLPTPTPASTPCVVTGNRCIAELTVDNTGTIPPFEYQNNGRTVMTVKDEDTPVGLCDLGKLVKAIRWDVDTNHGAALVVDNGSSAVFTIADGGEPYFTGTGPCSKLSWGDQRVCYAEESLKQAQRERDYWKQKEAKERDLKTQLERCEPKKGKP